MYTEVLAVRRVAKADIGKWVELWQDLLKGEDSMMGALCHVPNHGIRFFQGTRVLFETSVGFDCNNYYVRFSNGVAWCGFPHTEAREELKALFEKTLPIPKKLQGATFLENISRKRK